VHVVDGHLLTSALYNISVNYKLEQHVVDIMCGGCCAYYSPLLIPLYAVESAKNGLNRVGENIKEASSTGRMKAYDMLHPSAVDTKINLYSAGVILRNVEMILKRGKLYTTLERNELAISDFKLCLQIDPHNADAAFNYASILNRLGRHEEAIEQYTIAEKYAPVKVEFTNQEVIRDQVYDSFKKTKNLFKGFTDKAEMGFVGLLGAPSKEKSYLSRKQKEIEQVEDSVDLLLRNKVARDQVLCNKAMALMNILNYDEALDNLKRAIQLSQEHAHLYYFNMGLVHYFDETRSFKDAVLNFTLAIDTKEGSDVAQYYVFRACAYDWIGDYIAAENDRVIARDMEWEINVHPFHVYLVPNDTVLHILTFLDGETLGNVACGRRFLNDLASKALVSQREHIKQRRQQSS
jgi:tetratricopeptide (TPR) repeat protein